MKNGILLNILENRPKYGHWWELLVAMTKRELFVRYKRAEFGFLWIVITPVLQMLVIGMFFQYLLPNKIENYFIYLFSGLLSWNYFSQTVGKTTQAIMNERHLIKKAKFPRAIIILAICLAHATHFIIGLLIFTLFSYFLIDLTRNILLLPIAIMLLLMITLGLSLFFSALDVRFRDTSFMVTLAMQLLFYATPIVYSVDNLPMQLQNLLRLNPLTFIMQLFQSAFLGSMNTISVEEALYSIVCSLVILIVGILVFRKSSLSFDDWL
ncbi:ABC transporter permease [Candidatus Dojkabacteria bacterium]|nr:ABC transporter permease [Candidatus Dojkabacteria bacterium]